MGTVGIHSYNRRMSFIEMVPENEAAGRLKKLYELISENGRHKVPHILKVSSVNPLALDGHLKLYKGLRQGKEALSDRRREMIATVVSKVNSCHY